MKVEVWFHFLFDFLCSHHCLIGAELVVVLPDSLFHTFRGERCLTGRCRAGRVCSVFNLFLLLFLFLRSHCWGLRFLLLGLFYVLALLLGSVRCWGCVQVCLLLLWFFSLFGWNVFCRPWGFLWFFACFFWLWPSFSFNTQALRGLFLSRLASLLLPSRLAPTPTCLPSTSPSSASPPSSAAASLWLSVQLVSSRYVGFWNFLLTCQHKTQDVGKSWKHCRCCWSHQVSIMRDINDSNGESSPHLPSSEPHHLPQFVWLPSFSSSP